MASNLLSIAASGVAAASAGLNVTAQNVANASTSGYVRRSINQMELTSPESTGITGDVSMSGVLVTGVNRDVSPFLQQEARSTNSDAARANGNVTNLTNIESAVENSNTYAAIGQFTSALENLASNPTDTSLRASVLASANNMTQSFNLASSSLATAAQGMQADASNGVSTVNQIAQNLAQLNLQISADTDPASNAAVLLDQRDSLLQQLSGITDATTTIAQNGTVTVALGASGGSSGQTLVSGGTAATLGVTTATNGTISYDVGGTGITIAGGSLAADYQGLNSYATANGSLDTIAAGLISAVNTAQANGADLNGNAGAAMFSGSGAGSIAVSMTSGSQIAAAASGAAANSLDISNLTAMQNALTTANTAGQTNSLLFNLSSNVANATTTQTALTTIASQAQTQLDASAGVDLNTEAANLLQYQQAFQASSRVIQTAETIFQQLVGID